MRIFGGYLDLLEADEDTVIKQMLLLQTRREIEQERELQRRNAEKEQEEKLKQLERR